MKLSLRPMDASVSGERSFIARSWVESFASSVVAEGLTFAGIVKPGRTPWAAGPGYWRTWNPLVNRLLDRGRTVVADDAGLIAGFMCWEPWEDGAALHYLYTRLSYRAGQRGEHVARELLTQLPGGPVLFTHRSKAVRGVPSAWRYSMAPLFGISEKEAA